MNISLDLDAEEVLVAKKEIEPNVFMGKLENYINSKFDKLVIKY